MTSPRQQVVEIERILLKVLAGHAAARWWETPIPALHNATGRQMVAAGDGDKLLAYVRTYLEQGFS